MELNVPMFERAAWIIIMLVGATPLPAVYAQVAAPNFTGPSAGKVTARTIGSHSALPFVGNFERDASSVGSEDPVVRSNRDQQWRNLIPTPLRDPGVHGQIGAASTTVVHFDYVGPGRQAFPVSQSEIVAIGKVLSAAAFVTPDKTGVYTEFAIEVSAVLKGNGAMVGQELTAIRGGGSVVFPSGHRRNVLFDGIGYPKPGSIYLFFLHKMPSNPNDYGILTAYEFSANLVYALDNADPFTRYEGSDESKFLAIVENTITANNSGVTGVPRPFAARLRVAHRDNGWVREIIPIESRRMAGRLRISGFVVLSFL